MTGFRQRQIIFPPFRLDCADQRLYRDDSVIPLRPKTFEVLQYLAERPGNLVTKAEVLEALWPETSVTDTVLKVCIREIREALVDDPASPRFIQTAHRRGYRFIGQIAKGSPQTGHDVEAKHGRIAERHSRFSTGSAAVGFVGRDRELALLELLVEKALRGERQAIFITGEPGIGKTALVDALLERTADSRILIARGQCLEQYGASEAYMPLLDALSRLCRESGREHTIELLAAIAPTWLSQMPWLAGIADRQSLQRGIIGATRERMLREIAEAVEALTDDDLMILVLEDLHWSDYSTLDFVSYLARRREPARLLLIGTYRPAEAVLSGHPIKGVQQDLRAHAQCEELPLEFLTEAAVASHLAARLGESHVPDDLARLIHLRTDGNPLFMTNVIDYLIDRKLIVAVDGRWELKMALKEIEVVVPEGIKQMIEKHIENLSEPEQKMLEVASVAGVEFSTETLAAGLEKDVIEIEEYCDVLARRHQFLRQAPATDLPDGRVTARYAFIHALYQNALYDRVTPARRAQLHHRIGEHEETVYQDRAGEIAAELAMHFEQARDYRRAVKHLLKAADNASNRFANQEAVALSHRGLELLNTMPDTTERAEHELALQITLGVPLMATKGFGASEVEATYSRARELCQQLGESVRLFPALAGLWRFYLIRAEFQTARELAQQLLHVAESEQDAALMVEAHWAMEVTFVNLGEFVSALEHFDKAVALYDVKQHRARTLHVGHDLAVACRCFAAWALWCIGYPDRALIKIQEALALAEEIAHPQSVAFALFFTAFVHQLRRGAKMTRQQADAVIVLSSEQGFAQWLVFGTILRGWAIAEQGDLNEGIEQMRRGLTDYRAMGSEASRPHFLALLAEALGKAGQPQAGLQHVDDALSAAHHTGGRYYESELYRLKGELLLARSAAASESDGFIKPSTKDRAEQSVLSEALTCINEAINIARRQQAKSFELRAVMSLSRLLLSQGKSEDARRMLAEIHGWFTEGFDTEDLKETKALLRTLQ